MTSSTTPASSGATPEVNDVFSSSEEVFFDFPPFMRVLKDGTVDRYVKVEWAPPTPTKNPTGVLSKDVVISSKTGVLARLFIPEGTVHEDDHNTPVAPHHGHHKVGSHKLPLVVYIHGGAYCIESAFSTIFHPFVTSLVAEAKVVALSVDYRLTPENPITDCYEDTWAAIQWAVAHRTRDGPEHWLNRYVDFDRIFFAGDSAGGNISSNMAWRIGTGQGEGFGDGATLVGIGLIHPFFGFDDRPNALWELYCPDSQGIADPRLNPILHPEVLKELACKKVLVCVAEKDEFELRERGASYVQALEKSGWKGEVELFESLGETHDFQLFDPDKETARELRKKVSLFFNLTA